MPLKLGMQVAAGSRCTVTLCETRDLDGHVATGPVQKGEVPHFATVVKARWHKDLSRASETTVN